MKNDMGNNEPFCMIVDTREQRRLPLPDCVPFVRRGLKFGDYSIIGYEELFAVERKSLDDLVGTMIGKKVQADGSIRYNKDRFAEELTKMHMSCEFCYVAVEAPLSKLYAHYYTSRIDPINVEGMVDSISTQTGVHFKFFESPEQAAHKIASEALHFWRKKRGLSTLRLKMKAERILATSSKVKCPPLPRDKKPRRKRIPKLPK